MLVALAIFVPLDDFVKNFNELVENLPDDLIPVADYFEDNFMGRSRRRIRENLKYTHQF